MESQPMAGALKWFNVALRGVMEFGIVIALGYWGFVHHGLMYLLGETLLKQ
jgi:hypothetical protein